MKFAMVPDETSTGYVMLVGDKRLPLIDGKTGEAQLFTRHEVNQYGLGRLSHVLKFLAENDHV